MRSIASTLLLILCVCGSMSAQRQTLFEDRFDGNSNAWPIYREDSIATAMIDGVYRWNQIARSTFRTAWQDLGDGWSRNDWTLSVRVRSRSGTTDYGVGLAWGAADNDNLYILGITDDGSVHLSSRRGGEHGDIVPWKKNDAIRSVGNWNTLRVVKRGDGVSAYVNDAWVGGYVFSSKRWFGGRIGLMVNSWHDVEFDDLTLTSSKPMPLKLVSGIDTAKRRFPLPATVNSTANEYVDGFLPDGSAMYISRTNHPENVPPIELADLWITRRTAAGEWGEAEHLGRPINNEISNFLVSAMPDGNQLYLQNTYASDGSPGGAGFSLSQRSGESWSIPTPVSVDDFYNLGTTVSSCIAPNGNVMINALIRRDTKGDVDLYVSFRREDGTWTAPANMGSVLNTEGADVGPFVAGDDRTLIFSSTSHPGYGGYDLFVSRRLDDTWLNWSTPENIGPTLNTAEGELYLLFPASGDVAYFSTSTKSNGDDIYGIVLPTGARPRATVVVRGRVLDAKTKQPVPATVAYERLRDGKREGEATANPVTGEYTLSVGGGAVYGVRAVASGYYPLSVTMDLEKLAAYGERSQDLLLMPIETNVAIRLNNVFFESGKWELRPDSYPELDRLADFLRTNATVRIALAGHTDNVGADAANLALSQNRINSVEAYLVAKGIGKARLTAKGFGETRPIAPNDTEEGRQQNRRVEFTILGE